MKTLQSPHLWWWVFPECYQLKSRLHVQEDCAFEHGRNTWEFRKRLIWWWTLVFWCISMWAIPVILRSPGRVFFFFLSQVNISSSLFLTLSSLVHGKYSSQVLQQEMKKNVTNEIHSILRVQTLIPKVFNWESIPRKFSRIFNREWLGQPCRIDSSYSKCSVFPSGVNLFIFTLSLYAEFFCSSDKYSAFWKKIN